MPNFVIMIFLIFIFYANMILNGKRNFCPTMEIAGKPLLTKECRFLPKTIVNVYVEQDSRQEQRRQGRVCMYSTENLYDLRN